MIRIYWWFIWLSRWFIRFQWDGNSLKIPRNIFLKSSLLYILNYHYLIASLLDSWWILHIKEFRQRNSLIPKIWRNRFGQMRIFCIPNSIIWDQRHKVSYRLHYSEFQFMRVGFLWCTHCQLQIDLNLFIDFHEYSLFIRMFYLLRNQINSLSWRPSLGQIWSNQVRARLPRTPPLLRIRQLIWNRIGSRKGKEGKESHSGFNLIQFCKGFPRTLVDSKNYSTSTELNSFLETITLTNSIRIGLNSIQDSWNARYFLELSDF